MYMIRYILRLLVPVIFFTIVFHIIKPGDIYDAFYRADWGWFLIGSLCILILNYLCSLRTRELLGNNKSSLPLLFAIHSLSALISGFLPFRTGELSFVYYLKKHCVIPTVEGAAILVSIRFAEYLFFIIIIFILSALGIVFQPSIPAWYTFGIISANLVMIVIVLWKARWIMNVLRSLSSKTVCFFMTRSMADFLSRKFESFSVALIRLYRTNNSTKPLLLTLAIVIVRHIFVLSMLKGMNVIIDLEFIVLLFAFLYASKFIQGLGSFGNHEAGIVAALLLTGMTKNEALSAAIGTHLLQWAPILLLGGLSYIVLYLNTANKKS
ncbi:lysylphosphatidylglycerol synthase transmembrane domain-containing protein [Thermodesulfobacteriota bacterium]